MIEKLTKALLKIQASLKYPKEGPGLDIEMIRYFFEKLGWWRKSNLDSKKHKEKKTSLNLTGRDATRFFSIMVY